MKGFTAALAALAVNSAALGVGTFFQYESTNLAADGLAENTGAGKVSHLLTTYDPATSMFTWNITFTNAGPTSGGGKDTDGFWLVVGPGPNPKGHDREFAIMYFDGSSMANPAVTIYRYNGVNGDNSWKTPDVTGSPILASSKTPGQTTIQNISASGNGTRNFSFKVNAAAINSLYGPPTYPDWTGIEFGDHIGIWLHPVGGLSTGYNGDGRLNKFSWKRSGWYDGSNTPTEEIPAPASAALLAIGGLLAGRRRR